MHDAGASHLVTDFAVPAKALDAAVSGRIWSPEGTRPDERVSVGRLADLARLAVSHTARGDAGPSLIIVGAVAALGVGSAAMAAGGGHGGGGGGGHGGGGWGGGGGGWSGGARAGVAAMPGGGAGPMMMHGGNMGSIRGGPMTAAPMTGSSAAMIR